MKTLIAIALIATSAPALAAVSSDDGGASRERRVCVQAANRSGSRMVRRTCLTATQWRERLGPDWRQHLAGGRGVQDQIEDMQARTVATEVGGAPGVSLAPLGNGPR